MMCFHSLLQVHLDGAPVKLKQNPAVAAALPSIISGGTNLMGDALGFLSSTSTNHSNERIARQNREWQSKENEISRQWQEKMWDANNQYNTPSAMMARYADAGINPFLADASQVGSTSSQPSSPSPVGAPNQPDIRSYDFNGVKMAGANFAQALGIDANIAETESRSMSEKVKAYVDAAREVGIDWANKKIYPLLFGDGAPTRANVTDKVSKELRQMDLQYTRDNFEYQLRQKFGEKQAQADLDRFDMEFNESIARIGKMVSEAKVNDALANKYYKDAWLMGAQFAEAMARASWFSADAKIKEGACEYIVDKIHSEATMLGYQEQDMYADFISNSDVRDYKQKKNVRRLKVISRAFQPDVNPVTGFLNGFVSNMPTPIIQGALRNVGSRTMTGVLQTNNYYGPCYGQ